MLLWKIVPEEVAKSVRAAGVRVKRKPAKEKAAFTNPLTRTKTDKVKAATAAGSRKKAAAVLAPKNAQTQAELDAALRGGTSGVAAAGGKGVRKQAPRGARADPLVRHGYETQGPIAVGAFSTIVRARALLSGLEVAVKSFDNAKCKKEYQHLYLREGELGTLRAAKGGPGGASRWVANLIEEHVGPTHTYAILEYCAGGSLQRHLQKLQAKGTRGEPLTMGGETVQRLGAQVNAALAHLHGLDIAHRDLKPGNVIFFGNGTNHLKLCDLCARRRSTRARELPNRPALSANLRARRAPAWIAASPSAAMGNGCTRSVVRPFTWRPS